MQRMPRHAQQSLSYSSACSQPLKQSECTAVAKTARKRCKGRHSTSEEQHQASKPAGTGQAARVAFISCLPGLLLPGNGLAALDAAGKFVPEPYSPGPEVYAGAVAAAIPFVIGSWEFGKRILIQQRCERCGGSGLVQKRRYRTANDVRKCPDCGGFFPWQGWKNFFLSTATPGNGGPLMQPKGQTSVFYRVPDKPQGGVVNSNAEAENSEGSDKAKERVEKS